MDDNIKEWLTTLGIDPSASLNERAIVTAYLVASYRLEGDETSSRQEIEAAHKRIAAACEGLLGPLAQRRVDGTMPGNEAFRVANVWVAAMRAVIAGDYLAEVADDNVAALNAADIVAAANAYVQSSNTHRLPTPAVHLLDLPAFRNAMVILDGHTIANLDLGQAAWYPVSCLHVVDNQRHFDLDASVESLDPSSDGERIFVYRAQQCLIRVGIPESVKSRWFKSEPVPKERRLVGMAVNVHRGGQNTDCLPPDFMVPLVADWPSRSTCRVSHADIHFDENGFAHYDLEAFPYESFSVPQIAHSANGIRSLYLWRDGHRWRREPTGANWSGVLGPNNLYLSSDGPLQPFRTLPPECEAERIAAVENDRVLFTYTDALIYVTTRDAFCLRLSAYVGMPDAADADVRVTVRHGKVSIFTQRPARDFAQLEREPEGETTFPVHEVTFAGKQRWREPRRFWGFSL